MATAPAHLRLVEAPIAGPAADGTLSPSAVKSVTTRTMGALAKYHAGRRRTLAARLTRELKRRFPDRPAEEIRAAVEAEIEVERIFQERGEARWRERLEAALSVADVKERRARVEAFKATETRYTRAREMAARERAHSTVQAKMLEEASPRGAFWRLSGDVREHTPDCIAMAGRFWPWNVLRIVRPPLHHGCPCSLHGLDEAVEAGWMDEGEVPDEKLAMRRARRIMKRYPDMAKLTEARVLPTYDERLHPRNRLGRWRDKGLVARAAGAMSATRELGAAARQGREPRVDLDRDHPAAMRAAGYRRVGVKGGTHTWTGRGGRMSLVLDDERNVVSTQWEPPPSKGRRAGRAPQSWKEHGEDMVALAHELGREWGQEATISSFATDPDMWDTAGIHRWDGSVGIGPDGEAAIEVVHAMRSQRGGLLDPVEDADVLSAAAYTQRVSVHEVIHSVNPIEPETYMNSPADRSLEEALTEEAAFGIAEQRLLDQGQMDVLEWLARNGQHVMARGHYQGERHALERTLDRAGVPMDKRPAAVMSLKFAVAPPDRMRLLAGMIAGGPRPVAVRAGETPEDAALAWVKEAFLKAENDGSGGPFVFAPTRVAAGGDDEVQAAWEGGRGTIIAEHEGVAWVRTPHGGITRVESRAITARRGAHDRAGEEVTFTGGSGKILRELSTAGGQRRYLVSAGGATAIVRDSDIGGAASPGVAAEPEAGDLRRYLDLVAGMQAGQRGDWTYASNEEYVLKEGRAWEPRAMTPEEDAALRGPRGYCYENAGRVVALDYRPGYRYVEGWAMPRGLGIPIQHAWLVDDTDRVVDPTWPDVGEQYFGVEVSRDALRSKIMATHTWGYLDNQEEEWPHLRT